MLSVFLVDDEELIREGLKKLIDWEACGFRITGEADDGEEALKFINHTNTDIVITDLKMPFMDGLELTEKLKENLPGIKLIILTGFDDFSFLQQSIRNNVADYLLKPVSEDDLISSLRNIKKKIEESQYPYPFEVETNILESISRNEPENIKELIEDLFEGFIINKVNSIIACKILQGIMNTVCKLLDSEGINLKYIFKEDITAVDSYSKYENINLLKERVMWIFDKILNFKKGECDERIVNKIKDYIEKHYDENITLDMLAEKFFLNPSYISQLFKNETNENYIDYLSSIRTEKAKKLLTESNLSIQQISEMVGYANSKYFSQVFKKVTGVQPSLYKQNPPTPKKIEPIV